jgi:hypothetical protein
MSRSTLWAKLKQYVEVEGPPRPLLPEALA